MCCKFIILGLILSRENIIYKNFYLLRTYNKNSFFLQSECEIKVTLFSLFSSYIRLNTGGLQPSLRTLYCPGNANIFASSKLQNFLFQCKFQIWIRMIQYPMMLEMENIFFFLQNEINDFTLYMNVSLIDFSEHLKIIIKFQLNIINKKKYE